MKYLTGILFIACFQSNLFAQDVQSLEAERDQIINEIKQTNALLKESQQESKNLSHQFQLIQNQIRNREKLISTYNLEIKKLANDITFLDNEITKEKKKLSDIKKEYGSLLQQVHRSNLVQNKMLLLLSSASFNQAMARWRYFRQISSFRKNQKNEIEELQTSLRDKQTQLETKKQSTIAKKHDKESQKKELAEEMKEKDVVLSTLKKDIGKLRSKIAAKEKERKALSNKIANLIASKTKSMPASPAVEALSVNFEQNKGKLPWPTNTGIVVRRFGKQNHPVLKNIELENDGIDIQTDEGATVNNIFEGTVINSLYIPNNNMVVLVNHGSYFTVYSNLSEVFVSENQQVKRNEPLGIVGKNKDDLPVLHFEVWRKNTAQNPALWIKSR